MQAAGCAHELETEKAKKRNISSYPAVLSFSTFLRPCLPYFKTMRAALFAVIAAAAVCAAAPADRRWETSERDENFALLCPLSLASHCPSLRRSDDGV